MDRAAARRHFNRHVVEKGRHTQSKWGGWGEGVKKFTSINNEPTATQNKSQLKNCTKGQLASPAVSAGEIHVDLLSPAVTVRNYDPPQRGRGGGGGGEGRRGEGATETSEQEGQRV